MTALTQKFQELADKHFALSQNYLREYKKGKDDKLVDFALHHRQFSHEIEQILVGVFVPVKHVICTVCGHENDYTASECAKCFSKIEGFF